MTEASKHRYFIIYKPYKMVSQFVSREEVNLLGNLNYTFPVGTHAVGRLDNLSEGLLILTTNKKVTSLLFEGEEPHKRTYLVKVQRHITPEHLYALRNGVRIRIKGGLFYTTPPCEVNIVTQPVNLPDREDPDDERILNTWITITLTEGKYHQVRKMVAAVYHKCMRLIRISIEDLELGDMQPGEVRELNEDYFFEKLKIRHEIN